MYKRKILLVVLVFMTLAGAGQELGRYKMLGKSFQQVKVSLDTTKIVLGKMNISEAKYISDTLNNAYYEFDSDICYKITIHTDSETPLDKELFKFWEGKFPSWYNRNGYEKSKLDYGFSYGYKIYSFSRWCDCNVDIKHKTVEYTGSINWYDLQTIKNK
jgi:hypothetical protein